MENSDQGDATIRFGVYEVDPRSGELRKAGTRIRMQDQPFKVLLALLEHPGEVVSRDELQRRIWPNESFGDFDHAVNLAISKLRAALGDSAEIPRYVETLPRRGYRFLAPVISPPAVSASKRNPLMLRSSQTARDCDLELKRVGEAGSQVAVSGLAVTNRKMRERFAWTALALATFVAIGLAIGFILRRPRPSQPMRLTVEIGTNASLFTESGPSAILAPDGTHLALLASGTDQKPRIFIRALDQLQATVLPGTENARDPFFSPDGQWLGFFADGKLKKISIHGGAPVTICDASTPRGGSWGEDGEIVFAPVPRAALFKVSSAGGTPQQLTALDGETGDLTHRWPQVLPGGKAVLFTSNTSTGSYEDAEIMVYSLSSGQRKRVLHGGYYARYLRSGYLVYMHGGTMFAMPFDPQRLEVTGQSAPVLESIVTNAGTGGAQFSFSDDGNLVYVSGGRAQNVSIYWMDRQGNFTPLRSAPDGYVNPAFSPDGKRLALEINDGKRSDIWVYEWERDTMTRLTFGGTYNIRPVWTPDGLRITYSSLDNSGKFDLNWKQANGAGDALRLTEGKNQMTALSWRPDGKVLAFFQLNAATSLDILTLPVEGSEESGWKPGEPQPFVNSAYNELEAAFSPDGRWLAYESDESGSFEVYVRAFPGPGGKWQISTFGGLCPKWSRNGKELFYSTEDGKIMVAAYVVSGDSFNADNPRPWSPGQFSRARGYTSNFDLHPDGKRFAVLKAPAAGECAPGKVTFILNFFDELRSKVHLQK